MEITDQMLTFVPSNLLIVVVVLVCIGLALKAIPEKYIKNEFIPFILAAIGVGFAVWHTGTFNAEVVMEGIICASIATYAKNIQKQLSFLLGKGSEEKVESVEEPKETK